MRSPQLRRLETGKGMFTVLTIDDDEGILTLIATVLERADYTCLQANNGADGLELAMTHQPDLILLDDTLPVLPARDVSLELRSNSYTRHIPIIIFSAAMNSHNPLYIQELNGDGVLPKPFRPIELLDLLDSYLRA
jgi:two-component system, OmpR family, phosphate regulon response regulator PhoB